MPKTGVFVSYRREDSAAEAGRIYESIKEEFGDVDVFMDVSSISPGVMWPDAIASKLDESDIVVVVLGPNWFTAGIDDFGKRRIDKDDDWVRLEIEKSLEKGKKIIPVLVSAANAPPIEALPSSIQKLAKIQSLVLRNQYWEHDIQLLLRQVDSENKIDVNHEHNYSIYPTPPTGGSTAIELPVKKIEEAIDNSIPNWNIQTKNMEVAKDGRCVELNRMYHFNSFISAVGFMHKVAPGCDIAIHHPRWENTWKSLSIWLTTWDVGNRITDRDIQMAKYLDSAYEDYDGKED